MRKNPFPTCARKWLHGVMTLAALLLLLPVMTVKAQPSQKLSVSGVVTSTFDGEPVLGATVQVKGTANGTITDVDGKYSITVDRGQTLVFSYIGYTTQEKVANAATINVALDEANEALDEVVVVGYGVQKKKLVTGATIQVKGDDIAKLNTTSPLMALQGQTPGMTIMANSGQPGEGMKVNIRGLGTVGNSGPLYIIDGVRGDISTVNPSDIASIDVLKDAASAAIYGSQSANGVVLVTTKSGREGKAVIALDAYYGWQNAARKAEMLNAREYMTIMDEQNINSGGTAYNWDALTSIHDANGNIYDTDWVDAMFKDNATTQSYNLSITGGTQKGNYAVSAGYMDQEGIVGGAAVSNYNRYNFRVNSEFSVIDNLLKIGEQMSIVYYQKRGISVGNQYNNSLRSAFGTSPITPIYSDNGQYGSPFNDTSNSDWYNADGNPYGVMMTNTNNRTNHFTSTANFFAELEPLKNLRLRSTVGVKYDSENYRSYSPLYHFSVYSYNDTRTGASQSSSDGFGITWTNTLTYDWKMGRNDDHALTAMLGTEAYRSEGISQYGATGLLRDGFDTWRYAYLSNGSAMTSEDGLSVSGSPWDEERMMSYFGRVSWNWKERYMATATLRADASAKFAEGHRYGWFPSVSAGWILTNENWAKSLTQVVDYFKLRASWGQVGNQDIGNYMYLAPVTASGVYYNFGTTLGSTADQWGTYVSRLANEKLKWETSEQTNIGFDTYFLDQRLSLNFDFYVKTTKDWLVQPPVLATVGTGAPYLNGGDVKNTGVELALGWNDKAGDFNYYVNANLAYNKNEVGNIPNEDGTIHGQNNQLYDNSTEFYRASNGEPIGYFWGYKTAGIFQNTAEIDEWIRNGNGVLQANPQPGDVKYYDVNHDGAIDDGDKVNLGNGMPDVTFGFSLGFDWKGLDFNVTASGAAGQQIVQSYRNVGSTTANYTKRILDRWTGEGTSNTLPRVTNTNINYQFSDLFIQDGDFLRISDITIGYDLCKKLLKTKYVSQCRLYAQVQNAFTFTKYDGMDPEIGYGMDGWISGVDLGYYPRPRTVLVGVNLKF